jgi:hypothetical protein
MKKYLFLFVFLLGCGSNIVNDCQEENQSCFMENEIDVGICNHDSICVDCKGVKVNELIRIEEDGLCKTMKCISDDARYAYLRYYKISDAPCK